MVLATQDGDKGVGDYVLPPPQESPADEAAMLSGIAGRLVGRDAAQALADFAVTRPASWAVECALLDLVSRSRGVPLCQWLDAGAAASIAVNAVAEMDGVAAAIAAGYPVTKMKVGRSAPEEEAAMLHRLALPDGLSLRLDANRAWTWSQASGFLDAVADLPIDSLEEPLRDPSLDSLARLQAGTSIALAIDESLPLFGAEEILARVPVRRLVLKAATGGGLRAGYRLAVRARAAGMTCVVTSALDSAVGVAASAHLAAAAGSPGLAHGLSTAEWLAEDVAKPLPVERGRMTLASCLGLGVMPGV